MESRFTKNHIVWAKLYGHPWWPGYVRKFTKRQEYEIIFFGDFSRAYLSTNKVKDFEEFKPKADLSSKKIKASFEMAERVFKCQSTISEEQTKFKLRFSDDSESESIEDHRKLTMKKYSNKQKFNKDQRIARLEKLSEMVVNSTQSKESEINSTTVVQQPSLLQCDPKANLYQNIFSQPICNSNWDKFNGVLTPINDALNKPTNSSSEKTKMQQRRNSETTAISNDLVKDVLGERISEESIQKSPDGESFQLFQATLVLWEEFQKELSLEEAKIKIQIWYNAFLAFIQGEGALLASSIGSSCQAILSLWSYRALKNPTLCSVERLLTLTMTKMKEVLFVKFFNSGELSLFNSSFISEFSPNGDLQAESKLVVQSVQNSSSDAGKHRNPRNAKTMKNVINKRKMQGIQHSLNILISENVSLRIIKKIAKRIYKSFKGGVLGRDLSFQLAQRIEEAIQNISTGLEDYKRTIFAFLKKLEKKDSNLLNLIQKVMEQKDLEDFNSDLESFIF